MKRPLVIAGKYEHMISEDDGYVKIMRDAVGFIFLGTARREVIG